MASGIREAGARRLETFGFILVCVLASVLVGLGVGYYLGRGVEHPQVSDTSESQQASLATVTELLSTIADLTSDVGNRNTQIQKMSQAVDGAGAELDLAAQRQLLVTQIAELMASNHRLEEDLEFANSRLEAQAEELDRTRQEARTDPLTRVANRKSFDSRLRLLLGLWRRHEQPFAVILADLDHFKWINDTYGHQAGDRVLKDIGDALGQGIREGDFVARIGGDEFAVLVSHAEGHVAIQVAERLRQHAATRNFQFNHSQETAAVTLSFGVAASEPNDSVESVLERADQALYRSKRAGRNRVVQASPLPQAVVSAVVADATADPAIELPAGSSTSG